MAKTILVTGASSGIGDATARALLAAGHIVCAGRATCNSDQELKTLGMSP